MSWFPLPTFPMQTVAQVSVERILNVLPEGFLIAAFAWALLRILRRQNSGTRFAVWFLALLSVAALPVLGRFGGGQGLVGVGLLSAMPWKSLLPAISIPGRWALFVFLAWALGASVAMVRIAAGFWRLRQLRRGCTAIDATDLHPAVRKTVEAIGASRSVTITTSEDVRVPAAIGFWKRTIVLPAWALRELSPDDLNVILLHEFAHLRRWDDWTNLIQKMVRALFFFHPAVWWIENRLAVEREMACDDAVLAETSNPHGYASCLVSLLEKSLAHRLADKRWTMAHAAVHRAHEASLRLAQILDKNRPATTQVWKPALGMVGAFSVVCLMALPLAPQFVAFDRGMTASDSDQAYSAALSHPSFQISGSTTAIIPATLRTRASSSPGVMSKMTAAKVVDARVDADHFAGQKLAPARDLVVEASAHADREVVPQFQTLVFIEATQYGTADSPVWQVQVWRVTLVTQVRERLARVPVANSI
ncbi:MAG: M56 family metallopeptidase [Terriglobales bacterium]|jgi:beta-lactamase regulating signal transducer with metallopeptidase domain